jgi:hypothetical protein
MATIPGLKETYVQLKTRMEKAVEDFRKAMAATRTGRASVHMLDSVSVDLRFADAAESDRAGARAGAADDHGAAVRSVAGAGDRKGHSFRRTRAESDERRQDDSRAGAGADEERRRTW